MAVQPTLAPRATALWERQQTDDPINSFLSSIFNSPDNTDSIATSATTPSTTSTRTTSTTSRRTTSSTSSTPTSTFTPSSTSTTSTSSTPTTTSTTSSSSSSTVVTTSSPTTLVTTSNLVSGTSTSQVVVTTVVTPVVTTTASANRANANRSSSNAGLIGGVVGGVVGGLILLALLIALCCMASRRKSRTGHAYFLCFGERPSRNSAGDLGHSGGAWPTFDPQNDHVSSSYAAGAAGVGAGAAAGAAGAAAAGSRSRRNRRDQANATLPAQFANDDDPERYGYTGSNVGHDSYNDYQGYDAYNANAYASEGYPDMQERPSRNGAGALAAGAAAGGAASHFYNNASSPGTNRRSSYGHQSYGHHSQQDSYNTANMSPSAENAAPAPWTLPMMGWHDTHGPYSVAGVGQNLANSPPQAQFMVSPSEANAANAAAAAAAARNAPAQPRSPGPDYSHFDPPEVRDARARQAAAAALGSRGGFSRNQSHNKPTSPRRQSRRLSSNHGSPVSQTGGLVGGISPPAYVDAQDALEEVDDQPRRLHLANAEPDLTEDDSSRGGPSRRPAHNHKDPPPSSTYRSN
ncbi:hypothetical protein PHBOTO_004647 [Pseudozyma hubeiensis]|nr:hypothetical protein PHBOTO_004647 [Pseudozyma hubeiensis]